jgi:thymidine phosphorylase
MMVGHLIERKRDGQSLSADEWRSLVTAYTAGEVPDYQVAALLMAVYFTGLDGEELGTLTDAMLRSGARLAFGDGVPPRVDKHSTAWATRSRSCSRRWSRRPGSPSR